MGIDGGDRGRRSIGPARGWPPPAAPDVQDGVDPLAPRDPVEHRPRGRRAAGALAGHAFEHRHEDGRVVRPRRPCRAPERPAIEIRAAQVHRRLPFGVVLAAEHQVAVRRDPEPVAAFDLVFQLTGRPAGIAHHQQALLRAAAAGDVLQDFDVGREGQRLRHRAGAVDGVLVGCSTMPSSGETGPP